MKCRFQFDGGGETACEIYKEKNLERWVLQIQSMYVWNLFRMRAGDIEWVFHADVWRLWMIILISVNQGGIRLFIYWKLPTKCVFLIVLNSKLKMGYLWHKLSLFLSPLLLLSLLPRFPDPLEQRHEHASLDKQQKQCYPQTRHQHKLVKLVTLEILDVEHFEARRRPDHHHCCVGQWD